MADGSQPALGATTEQRLRALFARSALATAADVAELLGVDVKTLRKLQRASLIATLPAGPAIVRYTEAGVRAYLTGDTARALQEEGACLSTSPRPRATSTTISNIREIDFTAPRARRPSGRRRL